MKKIIYTFTFSIFISVIGYSQYFQGNITNPSNPTPPPATMNKLIFNIRPTGGDIITSISYMEFAFRYPTATTPPFSVASVVNNTVNFPNLRIDTLPDFVEGNYTYKKFVFNTGTIPSATYTNGLEKEVFTITLTGNPTDVLPSVEMASNLTDGNYVFGVVNGAGVQIDPGAGDQLYGPGFIVEGNTQLLPLINVPLPVKFTGFNALKRDNDAMLTWQVENESPLTDRYEIERSLNGVDFRKVYTITAKNNGRSSNTYSLTDPNLTAIRPSGVFYYHVKQIDKDGRFVYSDIKNLRLNAVGMVVSISPNPVRDIVNITMDSELDATVNITVTDASGQQVQAVKMQIFKGQNIKKVNMAALPIGSYMLKVQSPSETKTITVVKGH